MHYNNTQKERSIKSGVALAMAGVAIIVLLVIAARGSVPTGTDVSHLWRTQSILVNGKDVTVSGTATDTEDTVVKLITMEEEHGVATLIVWGTKRKSWQKDFGTLSIDETYHFDHTIRMVKTKQGDILWRDNDPEGVHSGGTDETLPAGVIERAQIDLAHPVDHVSGGALHFADADRLILSQGPYLIVFDKKTREVICAIDRTAIGMSELRSGNHSRVSVSADGETVFLHPGNDEKMYVLDIEIGSLSRQMYQEAYFTGVTGAVPIYVKESRSEWNDTYEADGHSYYVYLHFGARVGEVTFIEGLFGDEAETDIYRCDAYQPLFYPEGYEDAVPFTPEDLHDLMEVAMRAGGELVCVRDEAVLDSIETMLRPAKMIDVSGCPFYDPMYFKRADGTTGYILPATDSCNAFVAGSRCYEWDAPDNEDFWTLFPEILSRWEGPGLPVPVTEE